MIHFITASSHYKSANPPKIVYTSDSRKDMLAKARQMALTDYMVDCWSGKEWNTVGAVVRVGPRTAYLVYSKRNEKGHYIGDEYRKVNSDGTLSTDTTEDGIRKADQILRNWL